MRLIDADELKRKYAGFYNIYGKGKSIRCVEVKEIDWMPTIDAVPLDKLCEWLATYCEPPINASKDWKQLEHEARIKIWRWVLKEELEKQNDVD